MKTQENRAVAPKEPKVPLRVALQIFRGVKMPWGLMLTSVVFVILSACASLNVADFAGSAVDASGNIPMKELITYVVSALVMVLCTAGFVLSQNTASEKIILALRAKMWRKIIFTKQSVYEEDNGETLVSRITSDCEFASKFYIMALSILSLLITTGAYVTAMYRLSGKLSSYVLIFIPVSLVLGWIFMALSYIVNYKFQGALADSTSHLIERTKNLNLVKTCNAQDEEIEQGKTFFRKQYSAQLRVGYVTALGTIISSVLEMLGTAIPFLAGAALVASGEMTIGMLITFSGLFGNIRVSFNDIITYVGNISAPNGAMARVRRFFDEAEEQPDAGRKLPGGEVQNIVFERVTFAYSDRDVIKNLSCNIPKNKITAVIGSNGSGKSTLFKLLVRLYDPKSGEIRFGTENSQEYSLHSWRNQVCLIAQGAPMMAGTIRENICYGRSDIVSEDELLRVAKLSHVYDFVKDMPDGFDSSVAAGGENFSGGQRQCIAIARAMMSNSSYLLLDESTSNLDLRREKEVMEALGELMKGRTTIIIAHSIAAIKNADYVLVLNNGELESAGSPQEILTQTDNYLNAIMKRSSQMLSV